jgi:hypothetical protein
MPFALAHPAAVLPLRRFCPKWLSLPGLVAGSVSPDAGYPFSRFGLDTLSHRLLGSVIFCLPVGLAVVALFSALRSRVGAVSPFRIPEDVVVGETWRAGSRLALVVSVLIGAWTHIFWDGFTNPHGWFVVRLDLLQVVIALVGHRTIRVCHLLWYASSFLGMLCLCRVYQKSLLDSSGADAVAQRRLWLTAILVAAAVLPIGVVHHLFTGVAGMLLVTALTAFMLIGGILVMDRGVRLAACSQLNSGL